jgi:hypothetical protein
MTALAVDEYQHLVGTQAAQQCWTDKIAAIAATQRNDERRHQLLDRVQHVVGRNAVQLFPTEYVDRHGRIDARSSRTTSAYRDDDFDFLDDFVGTDLSDGATG